MTDIQAVKQDVDRVGVIETDIGPAGMRGRPGLPDFQRQYRRNPRRCQSITVAGFTKTSGDRQLCQTLDSATQKARS